jgi:hypothetical protein
MTLAMFGRCEQSGYNLATIWLQSGYNPANNPAYNRNQTRPYVPTAENIADVFMKPLMVPKFTYFCDKLGLVSA